MTTYSIKSNARRAARKAGLNPDEVVVEVTGGFAIKTADEQVRNAEIAEQFGVQVTAAQSPALSEAPEADAPAGDAFEVPGFLRKPKMTAEDRARLDTRHGQWGRDRELVMPKTAAKPKAAKSAEGLRSGTKLDQLIQLVKRPEGVTNAEIKAATGWNKLGGFFTGCKRAGLTLSRARENGDTRWTVQAQAKAA